MEDRAVKGLGEDPHSPWATVDPLLLRAVGRVWAAIGINVHAGPRARLLLEPGVGGVLVEADQAREAAGAHAENVVAATAGLALRSRAGQAGPAAIGVELTAGACADEVRESALTDGGAVALGQRRGAVGEHVEALGPVSIAVRGLGPAKSHYEANEGQIASQSPHFSPLLLSKERKCRGNVSL